MSPFLQLLKDVASVVTAGTVIGAACLWFYKKMVIEPDNRMAKRLQDENNKLLTDTVSPLTQAIENLNRNLELTTKEQYELRENVKEHENRLDTHEVRITVLETKGK
ncbi:hypothetical protein ABID29_001839 [Streptococcus rupicaprae]|uniref:Phage protein n=1 Tax=Streptococcus rupicaprae TaxID=759619 RepID=A0ABV2FJH8_9STRE